MAFNAEEAQLVYDAMAPKLRPEVVEFLLKFYIANDPHEDDFNLFRRLPASELAYIDVGANVGLTALSMMKCAPGAMGLGFEINPMLRSALEIAGGYCTDYQFQMCGLSDRVDQGILILPIVDGFAEYGEASLSESNFERDDVRQRLSSYSKSGRIDFQHLPVKFDTLDNQADQLSALMSRRFRLVKIDVEGHELSVLKGGLDFIRKSQPFVLIEEGHRPEIISELAGIGYKPFSITPDAHIHELNIPTLNTLFLSEQNAAQLIAFTL